MHSCIGVTGHSGQACWGSRNQEAGVGSNEKGARSRSTVFVSGNQENLRKCMHGWMRK